jgi:GH15 family glucan-1,4-alpha-glucosidase
MSVPIADYGLIGDCETAALVSRDGSIDWLCWPRFDSDSLFACLLGEPQHGYWRIGPDDPNITGTRRYVTDTLVLETELSSADGSAVLTDFMPPRTGHSHLVRLVRGVKGRLKLRVDLVVRPGYGREQPWIRRLDDAKGGPVFVAIAGPDMVALRTPVDLERRDGSLSATFEVAAGETVPFVLSYAPSHARIPEALDPAEALKRTTAFWRRWCEGTKHRLQFASEEIEAAVVRSLITLKALTYAPTGGIVAAPTTSLPEAPGGKRNWDYRFCWIRDATITLLALMDAGHYDEAKAWRDWLLRAAAGAPDQLQIMYGIAGERRLTEWEVDWLPGYGGARPVRIGNAAHLQLQLDVYGELMDALHQARKGGLPENDAAWELQQAVLTHLEQVWREPDEGLWEVRGPPRHFTYSKVMTWVAVDRYIRSAEMFGIEAPLAHWRSLREEMHREICAKGYDGKRGCFVQAYGSEALDASLLLLPTLGFVSADDPRFRGTVAAIERELLVDGFVRRYDPGRTDDGLGEGEGVFLACSFWIADAYAMTGRVDEAKTLFQRLLGLRNELGLLAEEYDPRHRRMLGNFPQAYSHVALIETAKRLGTLSSDERRPRDTTAEAPGGKANAGAARPAA